MPIFDEKPRTTRICDQAGAIISTGHVTLQNHPKHELQLRAFIVKTLEKLGLNVETIKPIGRPPNPTGWRPDLAS
jgi:hypothetical protein